MSFFSLRGNMILEHRCVFTVSNWPIVTASRFKSYPSYKYNLETGALLQATRGLQAIHLDVWRSFVLSMQSRNVMKWIIYVCEGEMVIEFLIQILWLLSDSENPSCLHYYKSYQSYV